MYINVMFRTRVQITYHAIRNSHLDDRKLASVYK